MWHSTASLSSSRRISSRPTSLRAGEQCNHNMFIYDLVHNLYIGDALINEIWREVNKTDVKITKSTWVEKVRTTIVSEPRLGSNVI